MAKGTICSLVDTATLLNLNQVRQSLKTIRKYTENAFYELKIKRGRKIPRIRECYPRVDSVFIGTFPNYKSINRCVIKFSAFLEIPNFERGTEGCSWSLPGLVAVIC